MKRLALDWGTVRVGVAVSDEDGRLAFARNGFRRAGRRADLERLRRLVAAEQPAEIVVGLPLRTDGSEGPAAAAARRFARSASEATGLPVVLWDERYSSAEAMANLRQVGLEPSRQRHRVDSEAARLTLQGYLDRRLVEGA